MSWHPVEALSAYADGELPPDEAADVEAHLTTCTECARELALIRSLGGAMRDMGPIRPEPGLVERVNRRLARPIGWLLVIAGTVLWAALAIRAWLREEFTLEWLATTAVFIGLALLAVSVAYQQYREWKHSPYKDLQQ